MASDPHQHICSKAEALTGMATSVTRLLKSTV